MIMLSTCTSESILFIIATWFILQQQVQQIRGDVFQVLHHDTRPPDNVGQCCPAFLYIGAHLTAVGARAQCGDCNNNNNNKVILIVVLIKITFYFYDSIS
jgi:hypothetical protein